MATAWLFGHPVAHSLSPAMHNAAFRALGLPHRYEALDVPPAEIAGAVERLRAAGALGANVTVPHKLAVMEFLDALADDAREIGAVNTIVRDGSGRSVRLVGHNTDRHGFVAALAEAGVDVAGLRALVLGAGGAARSAVPALVAGGARVTIANRTRARAVDLAAAGAIGVSGWPEDLAGWDLIVNATSLGLHDEDPLAGVALPASLVVYDLVPTARETPLVRRARGAGCRVVDGLAMLLHQAAKSFTLWTGENAPMDEMRAALPRRV